MAGIVKPTTKRVKAQVQKSFVIAVKKPPTINVARHAKKDNFRPILSNKIMTFKYGIKIRQDK